MEIANADHATNKTNYWSVYKSAKIEPYSLLGRVSVSQTKTLRPCVITARRKKDGGTDALLKMFR